MNSKNDKYIDLAMSILSAFRGKVDGAKQERHFEKMLAVYYAQLAQQEGQEDVVKLADEELLGASAAGNPFLRQGSPSQDANLRKNSHYEVGFSTRSPDKQR